MAVFGGTNPPVALNGATWVTLVAAPAAGKRREVLGVYVENLDTVTHTFKLRKLISAVGYTTIPWADVLTLLLAQLLPAPIVLDETAALQIAIEGAHTTTAPIADAAFFEEP